MTMLTGRTALITGASRGIGAAVAKRFAAEGAHCILVARDVSRLEEVDDAIQAAGGAATLAPMDLCELETNPRMIAGLYERFGGLDILVGNAGQLGKLTPLFQVDPEEWDRVFAANLNANFHLLRNCDPLLRRSPSGRVILVTSGAAAHPRAYWTPYAASKAALEAMLYCYADEVSQSAVKANLLDPGPIRTAMRAKAFPGEDPQSLRPAEAITDAFVVLAAESCPHHGACVRAADYVAPPPGGTPDVGIATG